MKCGECGAELVVARENYRYEECGLPNVTLLEVEVRRCHDCGAYEVAIPRLEDLHRVIAELVSKNPRRLSPDEIRYLRKFLGWSNTDFATHFGVREETVSRWQNSEPIQAPAERLLRAFVMSGMSPKTDYWLEVFQKIKDLEEQAGNPRFGIREAASGWEPASV